MSLAAAWVPERVRVDAVERENEAVATIVLEPHGTALPSPGQFSMLYLFGKGEAPISVSAVLEDGRVAFTIKPVGHLTRALTALRPGDLVGVRGPFGHGWPEPPAEDPLVLLAGGIGLAPLRPVLRRRLAATGRGPVHLVYGARRPCERIFVPELESWATDPRARVHTTVDRPEPGWRGAVGFVTEALAGVAHDAARGAVLVCGPPVMMRQTLLRLRSLGVDDARVYVSLERSMRCALGVCGHCQWGPAFLCRDGPVFRVDRFRPWLELREV